MKYKKKPIEIDAHQWFKQGDHPEDDCYTYTFQLGVSDGVDQSVSSLSEGKVVRELIRHFQHPKISGDSLCNICKKKMNIHGWINTLEGGHIVCPGDYIVKGVNGEYYPVTPEKKKEI